MAQMLLTKALRTALPALYATEKTRAEDKVLVVKFFNPCGAGTWYAAEFDGEDTFFGLVTGLGHPEWGYFSLSELASIRLRFGLRIERDIHWNPKTTTIEAAKVEREIADMLGLVA